MPLDKRTALLVLLASLFMTCLVVGDLVGSKLADVTLFGHTFTISLGMIPFPVTFLLTDLLNEFYGKRIARFVTLVGFAMALLTFVQISLANAVPIAPFTQAPDWTGVTDAQFRSVFAGSQRILLASMVAYLTAQLLDIAVFNALKRATQNRLLWVRATGSTLVSQLIDTVVIQLLAWYGTLPLQKIFGVVFASYGFKILVAVALTPVVYAGHALLERSLDLRPVVLGDDGSEVNAA